MEDVAREPGAVELLRRERRRDPAVGSERAVAAVDDGDDDARRALAQRADELDSVRAELPRDELAGGIVAPLRDAPRLGSELGRPGRDVGRLASRSRPVRSANVAARSERLLEQHDHVEQYVTERRDPQGTIVPCSRGGRAQSAGFSAGRARRRRGRGRGCPSPPAGAAASGAAAGAPGRARRVRGRTVLRGVARGARGGSREMNPVEPFVSRRSSVRMHI